MVTICAIDVSFSCYFFFSYCVALAGLAMRTTNHGILFFLHFFFREIFLRNPQATQADAPTIMPARWSHQLSTSRGNCRDAPSRLSPSPRSTPSFPLQPRPLRLHAEPALSGATLQAFHSPDWATPNGIFFDEAKLLAGRVEQRRSVGVH